MKKIPQTIKDSVNGWIGGASLTILFGLFWRIAFPAIVRPEHYYGYGPTLIEVILMALMVITPAALIGGIVGGRIAIEGGSGARRWVSILFGMILSLPFGCYTLWVFTGF